MQDGGVRQHVLSLLKEKGTGGCPKEKVMTKKCKGMNNKKDREKKQKFNKTTESKKDKINSKQGNGKCVV